MNNRKVKHFFFVAAIGLLYFAGVAAILYPMVSNVYSLMTSKTVINDYVETVAEMEETVIDERFTTADRYNADLAAGNFKDGLEKCLCDEKGLVCYVDIPTLSIYLPVYYGTSDEVLGKGCGTVENTSLPVGGSSVHSVISGHTGLPSAEMFTKLDQIHEGDLFFIHVLDRNLAYQVKEISAVTPDKTELLQIVKNKDYCTLLTCTPYGINDKRLLVLGERVEYDFSTPAPEVIPSGTEEGADQGLSEEIRHQLTVIAAIAIVSVILYIAGVLWLLGSIRSVQRKIEALREDEHGR